MEERKPRGYWTPEKIIDVAKQYNTLKDFREKENRAYRAAIELKILTQVTSHMQKNYRANTISYNDAYNKVWSYDMLSTFQRENPGLYKHLLKKGWYDKITKDFPRYSTNIKGGDVKIKKWTKEKLKKESLKYKTLSDFRKYSKNAYAAALKYNLIGTFITHLGDLQDRKPVGYWTYDKVKKVAQKYTNRKDFMDNDSAAAAWAKANGYWDDLTSDWDYLGSLNFRGVYAWEFTDKTVYVGLTDNFERREKEHLSDEGVTVVSKHMKETGLRPTFVKISDYLEVKEAQSLEECTIATYEDNGWISLNRAKAGGLGWCKRYWTLERVKEEAKKYNTKTSFKKGSYSAYNTAVKNGWMDEVTKGYKNLLIRWTPELVWKEVEKYNKLSEFRKHSSKAFHAARRLGIYDEIKNHLKVNKSPYEHSTQEDLINELPNYTSITNLRSQNPSLYNKFRSLGIENQMRDYYGLQTFTKWDDNSLEIEANKYNSRFDFQKGNPYAYQLSRKKGLLDLFFPKL